MVKSSLLKYLIGGFIAFFCLTVLSLIQANPVNAGECNGRFFDYACIGNLTNPGVGQECIFYFEYEGKACTTDEGRLEGACDGQGNCIPGAPAKPPHESELPFDISCVNEFLYENEQWTFDPKPEGEACEEEGISGVCDGQGNCLLNQTPQECSPGDDPCLKEPCQREGTTCQCVFAAGAPCAPGSSPFCINGYCGGCIPNDSACQNDGDCCSGYCNQSNLCAPESTKTCKSNGERCLAGGECCSGSCGGYDGHTCLCASNGYPCSEHSVCCSGYCHQSGSCAPQPEGNGGCQPLGYHCIDDLDCCSEYCNEVSVCTVREELICAPLGNFCSSQEDCCSDLICTANVCLADQGDELLEGYVLIDNEEGGAVSIINNYTTIAALEVPPRALNTDAYAQITIATGNTITNQISHLATEYKIIGNSVYNYSLRSAAGEILAFSQPVIISIGYTDQQIQDIVEGSLAIAYYDETSSQWRTLSTAVNRAAQVAVAHTTHFSLFSLIGEKLETNGADEGNGEEEIESGGLTEIWILNPLKISTIQELIDLILNWLLIIAVPLATIVIVWAGVVFMTSKGDREKVAKAKKILIYALIGVIILLLAKGMSYTIANFLTI